MRPFITIGADRPPKGTFHAKFAPLGDHFDGSPFSCETPSRAGPRHSAQSLANAGATSERERKAFKKMERRLVILDFRQASRRKV
jgi:hypothetical protein